VVLKCEERERERGKDQWQGVVFGVQSQAGVGAPGILRLTCSDVSKNPDIGTDSATSRWAEPNELHMIRCRGSKHGRQARGPHLDAVENLMVEAR
jgi:hypothetical protein